MSVRIWPKITNVIGWDVGHDRDLGHIISLGIGEYTSDISTTTCPVALQIKNEIQHVMKKKARQ